LKGLSDYYYSSEIAVKVARQEASGSNKRATLMEYLLKEIELDKSSKPNLRRAKGSTPEKNTTSKKELLTLSLGKVAEGS
jgi:hypothetical protein